MLDFDYDNVGITGTNLELESFKDIELKIKDKKVCVFLGAGFSKAWDNKYPLSSELFGITESESLKQKNDYPFFTLFDSLGLKWGEDNSSLDDRFQVFKSFKYMIDIYKRYPSLLPSHLDKYTLDFFENDIKKYIKTKFSTLIPNTEFKLNIPKRISKDKKDILNFFRKMRESKSLDIITTNYDIVIDRVLEAVQPKKSTLRGIPVQHNNKIQCPQKGGVGLYKINGGFEVIQEDENFKIDYSSLNKKEIIPNIILPSNEQNYNDKYFKNTFIKSSNQLRNADILIFIGYSFPQEDFIINFLLKSFLDTDNINKETIIISRNKKSALSCHEKACNIFKELHDNSGLYYYGNTFKKLCEESE